MEYARTYAGTRSMRSCDDHYWDIIGEFSDCNYYNYVMDLNRTPEDKYTLEADSWYWIDEIFRNTYVKMRNASR